MEHTQFASLEVLNEYNCKRHSSIDMNPIDRYNLDRNRIKFLPNDEYTNEVFFIEENRKVSKTNVFSIHKRQFECPVDLREKSVQIRYRERLEGSSMVIMCSRIHVFMPCKTLQPK